jgi:hypothetical protein
MAANSLAADRPVRGWLPARHIVMTPKRPSVHFQFSIRLIMEFTFPEKTCKMRLTIRFFLVKQTFLTQVFVIVFVLWMGKRGMEKDWFEQG